MNQMTDITLIICVTILVILFAGTPDLMDTIISMLQCKP